MIAAIALVLLGLVMVVFNEAAYNDQKAREIGVQAQIISASVAPALMFSDNASAAQYLQALSANPGVSAAAVYDARGARIATYNRPDEAPPPDTAEVHAPRFEESSIVAVTPVYRDGQAFGAVYLRTDAETPLRRFSRYAGVGVLILLAALVLTVLGLAQGALTQVNSELAARAQQLQQEIEQRKRAEEALLQSQKMEAIGQLTGGVAHDFNNLLMVVQSGLRLMERHSDPVRRAATVEAMRQALERGAGLTRQLLALARRQTLKLEAIDLAMHLRGMRELLARSLRADILVDINTARDLWPVKTDPTQFEVAILNLAVNARDAMPKGGVLTISAKNQILPEGEFVEIKVSDTGLGMPADVLPRVFEPYFTTKQIGQGTGLGLSQVYGIVTQSGGNIRVESVTNEGTSVIVLLPRSLEPAAIAASVPTGDSMLNRIAGKSVLIVEDDDAVANAVDEMLREMGCATTRVTSAQAALSAVEDSCSYDLIFSDIVMPGTMNGVDLARELRRRYPNTPIVLTSGFSGTATVDASFPMLRKPYKFEDLMQVVSRATAAHTAESA